MQTETHGNNNGLNDLHILPDNEDERNKIQKYLTDNKFGWDRVFSDVKGQAWYGKWFFQVFFAEKAEKDIRDAVA